MISPRLAGAVRLLQQLAGRILAPVEVFREIREICTERVEHCLGG